MTPERWRQVEEVYHAALERDPDQRPAFLSQTCAGDTDLKREVESLLAQKSGDSLLGRPTWESAESLLQPTLTQLSSGTQLGPYRIETPLGKGGMGEVFRATDTRLHRTVAIKILPRDRVADPERKKRFLQEARAASALNHPNIVTLYDIASDAGVDYLVMECVPGNALDKMIPPKGLPLTDALDYAHQIASGLAAAHAAGIVHRDMKPANVMVTSAAQVKILDFGLAKLAERAPDSPKETQTQDTPHTAAGTVMGTVAYMSPEQAAARPLDHRSDIFSLGIMLYEMLGGTRPFRGNSQVETMHAIMHDAPPALPKVSPRVQEILDKTLEKDPKERYQSAADMAVDLRRVQKEVPAIHKAQALATSPSNPWRWMGAAALLIALGGAGWIALRPSPLPGNPLDNARFTGLTDFPGDEMDAAISPDGKFIAFVADRDGPFDIFLSQVGSGSFANLTHGKQKDLQGTYRPVGFSRDGSEIWLHDGSTQTPVQIMSLVGGEPRVFLGKRSFNVAWSPDGSRLAYHTSENGDPMFIADSNGGNVRQIFVDRAGAHNHFPVWSPDGKWIYFVNGIRAANSMDLWRIPSAGGAPQRLTRHNANVAYPAPIDERTVLYVTEDADGSGPWLWALDVETKLTRRVSFGLEKYTSVAASGDGRRLVATVAKPVSDLWTVQILDRLSEERDVERFPLSAVRARMPRFGGAALFYVSSGGSGDSLYRYQNGHGEEIWKGADGALLEPPAVAPDGRRVAFALRRNGRLRLQVENADGTEPRFVGQNLDVRGTACWSPDSNWIVTGGSDGQGDGLFKIPVDGSAPVRLASGLALNPIWSPDGSMIAYGGADVGRLSPLLALRPDGSRIELPVITLNRDGERIRFLPDGKGLVYMQGQGGPQDFWLLDLATKKSRVLTHLNNTSAMRTFDISPDGREIVFDRLRENSDIVLIVLPEKAK